MRQAERTAAKGTRKKMGNKVSEFANAFGEMVFAKTSVFLLFAMLGNARKYQDYEACVAGDYEACVVSTILMQSHAVCGTASRSAASDTPLTSMGVC